MYSAHTRMAVFVGCLLVALVALVPSLVQGDEWNRMTRFSINHQFQVPGMTLQANTPYVIRLMDSPSNRNIVQIYNTDQTKMLTMFMAISAERAEPRDETMFSFIETEPGFALPIKEWFYPGRTIGLEFIYPKEQAVEISRHTQERVLTADTTNLHDLATLEVEAIPGKFETTSVTSTAANVIKQEESTVVAEKPSTTETTVAESTTKKTEEEQKSVETAQVEPEVQQNQESEVQIAQNTTVTQPEVQQVQPSETRELPRTAGELPLIALIGLLCVGAGLGLKVLSTKA